MKPLFALLVACAAVLTSPPARAIPFDLLDESQVAFVNAPATSNFSTASATTILGGKRLMQVSRSTGTVVFGSVGAAQLAHSQNVATLGSTTVAWDGFGGNVVQPNGLGGLDITADGATAFRLVVGAFDFPSNSPLRINIFVYDMISPIHRAQPSPRRVFF